MPDMKVTAFVRTPAKLKMKPAPRILQGDVGDAVAVLRAIEKSDVALSALGTARRFRHDPVVVEGIRNIVDAMTQDRPRRLIYLSGIGVRAARQQTGAVFQLLSTVARNEIVDHEIGQSFARHCSPTDRARESIAMGWTFAATLLCRSCRVLTSRISC
jgi:putative NADH-flavin reductase